MAKYRCTICGYVFDEEKEGKSFDTLEKCPVCGMPKDKFTIVDDEKTEAATTEAEVTAEKTADAPDTVTPLDLSYDSMIVRHDPTDRYMEQIHEMAMTGKSISGAMSTKMPMPSWDDILLLGAQLDTPPLFDDEAVNVTTVIGKNAKRPMILGMPVFVSHMSFGALSKETKISLARGSAEAGTAMCSGEGGILPEEFEASYKYIFEYVPNKYAVTDENLRKSDAIEIKIGQGTKPGMADICLDRKSLLPSQKPEAKRSARTLRALPNSRKFRQKKI